MQQAPPSFFVPPPPPPRVSLQQQQHKPVPVNKDDDNRHKNKSLIQQTLENVRNVGKKTKSPTDPRIPSSSHSSERPPSAKQSMPKDPRLKRMMTSDPRTPTVHKISRVAPPPPPPFPKPVSPLKKAAVEKAKVLPSLPAVAVNSNNPAAMNTSSNSLSRPYSPSQALPPFSPKGELPMEIDDDNTSMPLTEETNGKAVEVVKLEEKKKSPILPRKEDSIFNETNLSEAFSTKHLVTSTPKVPIKPAPAKLNDSSGFNFDFLK
uniref:Uncharacterized protein n=1 Tax=Ditylenchus dipsaci TaxID=166011 RepID=A0A915DCY2_9BILA